MAELPLVLKLAVLSISGIAAISDLRTYTIPNIFPILTAVLFIISIPFMDLTPWLAVSHISSGALGFVIGFVMFVFGLMGGGDVKLFAALCLFIPLGMLAPFAAIVAIAGGIFAAGILIGVWLRKKLAPLPDGPESFNKVKVPYGVGIFAGVAILMIPV